MRLGKGPGLIQRLGVALLLLDLAHLPLPVPDYHSLRHQHAPGQVCTRHKHLLRQHRGVASNDDRPVFHWHWAMLGPAVRPPVATDEQGPVRDSSLDPGQDASMDEVASSGFDAVLARRSRLIARRQTIRLPHPAIADDSSGQGGASRNNPHRTHHNLSATYLGQATWPDLLQRWTC